MFPNDDLGNSEFIMYLAFRILCLVEDPKAALLKLILNTKHQI